MCIKYTKDQQIKHLNQLADFLYELPEENYDQEHWGKELMRVCKDFGQPVVNCGSSACALGWCTNVFPSKFALMQAYSPFNGDRINGVAAIKVGEKWKRVSAAFDYDAHNVGHQELREFFGITQDQAKELFASGDYTGKYGVTPQQKAKQIRQLVLEKESEC